MNETELVLYASVKVENSGVLENAKIELTDTNFELQDSKQNLNIGTLKAGQEKTLELPIQIKKGEVFNLKLLDMISTVTLEGNYKNEDKTINIETPKYAKVNWTSEAIEKILEEEPKPIELSQELITNKMYNIDGTAKRVIQYKIKSGITDSKYPIKSTTIELQAPKYNEETKKIIKAEEIVEGINALAPEKVTVTAYSLNATNSKEILNFKEYQEGLEDNIGYTYNAENGIVTINVANKENESKEIVWSKGQDEFIVTYIYPADIQVATIESIASNKIALHDLNNRTLTKRITNTQNVTEEFGDIVTLETSANNSLYKGNMYIGEETIYATKWTTKISNKNISETIRITDEKDLLNTAETTGIESEVYYKNTYINKKELDYILGEQGSLKIYNNSNQEEPQLIAQINSQTQTTEDGVITIENEIIGINYQDKPETIIIEITNPANAGLLNIYNQKAIKPTNIEEVASIKTLKTSTRLFAMQEENEIVEAQNINEIELLEPISDAEFGISQTKLSTTQENDVNFTVTLKTDDLKYNLYQNPTVTITLPEEVEGIEVAKEDITILNSDELQLETLQNENNKIKLTLTGEQTKYNSTNTQISINAKIATKKLIPTVSKDIVMTLTNGDETVTKSQTVNFEAETGMLLATSLSNYNSENKTITVFGQNNQTVTLETAKEAKEATVTGTIINNTKSNLEETVIFGKIQNEGSSINTVLNSEIEVKNVFGENTELQVEIYYTEDANPTLESNWTNTATSNTTAYRIVCKNLNIATVIEFAYKIAIPENLDTNKNAEINYQLYANNQTYVAPKINMQTPKEVKLTLELTADVNEGQEVYEGQIITYNIKVKNTGEADAENIKINSTLSEGLTIIEGQTTIEGLNIKTGETVDKQIKAIVNKDTSTVIFETEATTDYLLEEAKTTITNPVSKVGLELEINNTISTYSEHVEIAQIGSSINYQIKVTNTSDKNLSNVQIKDVLPEELKYENELYVYKIQGEEFTELDLTQIENSYNEQTRELKVKIDSLKPGEKALISIYTDVEKVIDKNIINSPYVTVDEYPNVKFSVIDNIQIIGAPIIKTTVTSNAKENINAGDIIEYIIKVKNEGETKEFITIESVIPEQLTIQSAKYYYIEEEQKDAAVNFNTVSLYSMELKQNEELTVKITAKAKEITTNKEVESKVTIDGVYTEEVIEKIENTVIGTGKEPNDNPNNNPSQNPSDNPDQTQETYSISGVAWQDDNKNGLRDAEETVLNGITVKIIDANTNEYLLDEQGNEIIKTTNEDGKYEFANLNPGKYVLVYEFNKTTFSPTAYQKEGVESTLNSDARLVTEENQNIIKTDTLEITSENVSNIDIGLIKNPIFDLKLDKYITKVSVQNSNGTKIYEYDKTQLAKVEIPAKVLEGSLIIVEYQIDITNEGDVPGQVDTIVDYVSPQFEFKSELNTEWYQENDNNLYCIEFANEDLNPGETKSTKLVLTKTMTNTNTGLVNNAAEIYEAFNEYAYEDIDSKPANKGEEDDLSQADLIISIKTGGPFLYIGIVIITMVILSAGIYLINKKVIKNNII